MEKIQYPEYEVSNKNAELEAERKAAENRMREQEDKARRDRDMAIFGDVANLFAQGAALHVGGKNIEKTPSAAATGNERLRKLQEGNSKQLAEYARQQIEARDAERKERNAQKLAQYNAEVEQYKRDLEAEKYAKEQKRKDEQEKRQVAESVARIKKEEAMAEFYKNGGNKSAGGSSVNRDVFIVKDDGTKEYFRHADDANNVQAAYARLPKEYRVVMAVPRTETIRGRKVYVKDSEGKQVYDYMEDLDASLEQKRQAISDYNNRELIEDWTPEEDEIIDYEP